VGVYIYESESIAIRNRNILEYGSEQQESDVYSKGTQECYVGTQDRNWNWNWD